MKKIIAALIILNATSVFASDDVCGIERGVTFCAKNFSFEESIDQKGIQRYILSGLYRVQDGVEVKLGSISNKTLICSAIIRSYHSEHLDDILSVTAAGRIWSIFPVRKVECLVEWKR